MTNIRDVAKHARVSTATVSRVLNGATGVSEKTKARVVNSVRELGYVLKSASQRSTLEIANVVGLIVPDLENSFYGSIAKGMQQRARASEWVITVSDTGEDPVQEIAAAEQLLNGAGGAVLASPRSTDEDLLLLASRGKVVLINRQVPGMASVSSNNYEGLSQTFQHLRASGHVRIGYAGGPATSWSEKERRVILVELREAGLLEGVEVIDLGNFFIGTAGGLAAADLAIANKVSAVVAFNDHLAFGLISRLQSRGMRVPEDISVVGFDDVPLASLMSPPLTTVSIPAVTMGARAVQLLLDDDEYQKAPQIRSRVELQVRSSTSVVS